jgi:tetratricopeptide (TPR) repeat protein/TolB-like protein/predicted Ser/Thr protein kinase
MPDSPSRQADVTPADSSLSGTVAGRFLIRGQLGVGGMGEVYRADDLRLKRTVALKRMSPHLRADQLYRERFFKEAERASGLTGEHVAAVYDVLEENGEIFLVMEYVEGETLRKRLRRPLALEEFLHIALQCADALVAAHAHGIVHCDLKPENIMLTATQQVKILDFGVAKHLPRTDESSTVEEPGGLAGTPAYMSPEVLLDNRPDGRADIFSLGVVFYEALTGNQPFKARSFVATSQRILQESPPPVRGFNPRVPPALESIVSRMLAKAPEHRIARASQLAAELRGVNPHDFTAVPLARSRGFRVIPAAILGVLVVILLLGAVLKRHQIEHWLTRKEIPEQKYLAVLPFNSTAGDANSRAFSAGLTESLAVRLKQLGIRYPLQVVPPSEILAEGINTVEQAHKSFGANLVLEGSVRESGTLVRVNYSLVDAQTRRQLQADTITIQASDPFALEDRVVDGVMDMLGMELQNQDRTSAVNHGTAEPAAYDFYLRGRGYLQDYHKPESVDSAIAVFTHALERDPSYALAYAGLGQAYWHKYEETHDEGWVSRASQACQQAVQLGRELANGHTCIGVVYNGTGRYEQASEEFQRAAALDPESDDALRGLGLADERLGKLAEAESNYQRAVSLHPNYWADYNWLGSFYYTQARYEDAAKMFSHVVALAPDSERGYSNLGGVYLNLGRYADAIPLFERSVAIRPTADAYSNLATGYFFQQRFPEAARTYEQAVKLNPGDYELWGNLGDAYYWAPKEQPQAPQAYGKAITLANAALRVNPRDAAILCNLALYHGMLREKDAALAFLKRALALAPDNSDFLFKAAEIYNQLGMTEPALTALEHSIKRGYSRFFVRDHPIFGNFQTDPRFRKLVDNQPTSH